MEGDEARKIRAREAQKAQVRLKIRAIPRLAGVLDRVEGWADQLVAGGQGPTIPDLLKETVKGFELLGRMTGETPEILDPKALKAQEAGAAPAQIVMIHSPNYFGSSQEAAVAQIREEAAQIKALKAREAVEGEVLEAEVEESGSPVLESS